MANRRLLLLLLCGFILFPFRHPGSEITFIDVGQGDGIYLNAGENIMIDGGSSSSKSIGENTIEPFLLSHAVPSLDKVFITHADSDHTSGLLYLAESGKISADELYLPFCAESHEKYDAIRRICPDIRYIGAGDVIPLNKGVITCLWPDRESCTVSDDINEHSLILLYTEGNFSALLMGDAGKEAELQMLDYVSRHNIELPEKVTVLKAGHHGSSTSTSGELLSACTPYCTVLSYGSGNRYGHPHRETLDMLENRDIPHLDTARSGALTFYTNGHSAQIHKFLSP